MEMRQERVVEGALLCTSDDTSDGGSGFVCWKMCWRYILGESNEVVDMVSNQVVGGIVDTGGRRYGINNLPGMW